jgi:hypothetical protein
MYVLPILNYVPVPLKAAVCNGQAAAAVTGSFLEPIQHCVTVRDNV